MHFYPFGLSNLTGYITEESGESRQDSCLESKLLNVMCSFASQIG